MGHALEAETSYVKLLHGEAVGFGMVAAARLAESLGILEKEERRSIEALIAAYGPLPKLTGINHSHLIQRIQGDKKTVRGQVHFVLPEKIGAVRIIRDPELPLIHGAVKSTLEAFGPNSSFTKSDPISAVSS